MRKKTLILGCGIGGIVASTVLKKIMKKDMDVTVIDKNAEHHFAASFPLLITGKRKPDDISRNLCRLEKKGVNFVHAEVTDLDLLNRIVTTSNGNFDYDYLIICPGAELHPETIPGFKDNALNVYEFEDAAKVYDKLNNFIEGHIALFISSLPYKCPPAPYEIMFYIDEYFKQKGNREKVKLTIVTPELSPESLAKPKVGQKLRKLLAQKNIHLITEANVVEVGQNSLTIDKGREIEGDLFLGVASHQTPQFLQETNLVDDTGWVNVDQYTLQTHYPNVYAIGDCAGVKLPVIGANAPKGGIFAHYQAEVVARNIASIAKGKKPKFRFTGKGTCVIYTGSGKGSYISLRYYHKPAPFFALLKPMKPFYWGKIAFEKYWLNCWI